MEAKDTGSGWPTEREENGMLSKAEIFEAGKQAGIKEVVDWGNEKCSDKSHHGCEWTLRHVCSFCWQAKLKEWGL